MRVDERIGTGGLADIGNTAGTTETAKAGRDDSSSSTTRGAGDRVELSSTLAGLSRALSSDGAARTGRVSALALSYQSGNYRPDPTATASGLVSDALAGG
jgi:anti-sigma28 factor (negative regulator of flagellin synthesis)